MRQSFVEWRDTWGSFELVQTFDGPFSISNSSYRTTQAGYLTYYRMNPTVNLSSFSLAFYLRVVGNETVGIYQDEYSGSQPLRFSLLAVGTNLELHTHNAFASYEDPSWNQTVSFFLFSNVFKPNQWVFVGLVYDSSLQLLNLYDQSGNIVDFKANVAIDQVPTEYVDIGDSYRFGTNYQFSPTSAIACLSLHKIALTQMDMALLPCACQSKDKLIEI